MLAHSLLSRFPRGLFVWIAIEGANAPATSFGPTRKASRIDEASKE